jgi:hypothetical protein
MMTQHSVNDFISEFFTPKTDYSKFDSFENRTNIAERVLSYRIWPSPTAVKRAVLELVTEGKIARVDGKNELDDAREAAQAAENEDRRTALATALTQADANRFASMSQAEIAARIRNDRVFRFRYEAAARRWGFRIPETAVMQSEDDQGSDLPRTAQEWNSIPTRVSMSRYQREPQFKAAVDRLIREGQI